MLNKEKISRIFEDNLPDTSKFRIYFQRLSMDGLEEMHHYSKDKRLYEFLEYDPFKDLDDTRNYIDKLSLRMRKIDNLTSTIYWFVRRKNDKKLIGTACLQNLDYERSSIEWGYGIDPDLWGLGYILEIQESLKHFVFEILSLNRLYGKTMVTNQRTIQSVIAAGMSNEGIAKEYYYKDKNFVDAWLYALTSKIYFRENSKIISKKNNSIIQEKDLINTIQNILFESKVDENSSMENILEWDSMNHMLIIAEIEEKYKIKFAPSEITKATSIKAIIDLIS